MGKIKCEVVRDLMPLVIDDVASEESKQLVHAHMADCEGCKGYYAGMTVGISRNTTVPDSDKTFIRLGKRMKRKMSLKKLLIWLTIIVVVWIGVIYAWDQAHMWVVMDHNQFHAQLAYDYDGTVYLKVENTGGPGWYSNWSFSNMDGIYYITPEKPALTLQKGRENAVEQLHNELLMTEDGLCIRYMNWDEEMNPATGRFESVRRDFIAPLRCVRFGIYDNYTTLYVVGDRLPTLDELHTGEVLVSEEEYPLIAAKNLTTAEPSPLPTEPAPASTLAPEASPTPETAETSSEDTTSDNISAAAEPTAETEAANAAPSPAPQG